MNDDAKEEKEEKVEANTQAQTQSAGTAAGTGPQIPKAICYLARRGILERVARAIQNGTRRRRASPGDQVELVRRGIVRRAVAVVVEAVEEIVHV